MHTSRPTRRQLLLSAGALGTLPGLSTASISTQLPQTLTNIITRRYPNQVLHTGPVNVELPALSENGNSVAISVSVDQTSIPGGVRSLAVFAEKNPIKEMARFHFPPPPPAQVVHVSSRVRLADSQTIAAVAEAYSGELFVGSAEIIVTLAACVDLSYPEDSGGS